jgi:hypothetical protein
MLSDRLVSLDKSDLRDFNPPMLFGRLVSPEQPSR